MLIMNLIINIKNYQYITRQKNLGLLIDKKIIWHSDDCEYESASKLVIEKKEEKFLITFHKSKNSQLLYTSNVRISNSGSRYEPFNITFMNMYRKLQQYKNVLEKHETRKVR